MSSLTPSRLRSVLGLVALAAVSGALAALARGPAHAAPEPAPAWFPAGSETIESLLTKLAPGQLLLVEVSAEWCAPCHQLHDEVLATADGLAILERDRGLEVDFESDYGQATKRKYGVLGLPTMLVLDAEGVEVGRIEGYPGKSEWLEAVRDVKAGRHGLAALEKQAKKKPADVERQIELAQARLVRGEEPAGLKVLGDIIARSSEPGMLAAAAHAGRVKGRWLLRVREDGPAALAHYQAMMARFAGTPHGPGFLYWTASAYRAVGDDARALGLFDGWIAAEPAASDGLVAKADFMVHFAYPTAACEAALRRALARLPEAAELHYLLARVLVRAGDRPGAASAIAQALRLEPEAAMYRNYAAQLAADGGVEPAAHP